MERTELDKARLFQFSAQRSIPPRSHKDQVSRTERRRYIPALIVNPYASVAAKTNKPGRRLEDPAIDPLLAQRSSAENKMASIVIRTLVNVYIGSIGLPEKKIENIIIYEVYSSNRQRIHKNTSKYAVNKIQDNRHKSGEAYNTSTSLN